MATTKLVIRPLRSNQRGECTIYVRYTHRERSMLVSTGERVAEEHWDTDGQRVRKALRGYTLINEVCARLRAVIEDEARRLKLQGLDPALEQMRAALSGQGVLAGFKAGQDKPSISGGLGASLMLSAASVSDGKQEVEASVGPLLADAVRRFREVCGPRHSASTQDRYRVLARQVEGFDAGARLASVGRGWVERFCDYLFEQGLKPNTVGSAVKTLKTCLGWCEQEGMAVDASFRRVAKPASEPDIVALTWHELEAIKQLDLSDSPELEAVRAGFVLSCLTSLRYSDLSRLSPEHLQGEHIVIKAQKTGSALRIPLSAPARAWLSSLPGGFVPAQPSNRQANEALRKIARRAGLLDTVVYNTHEGRSRVERRAEKWQLVTTHTGRRTFVTLSLEAGMRPETVMRITGHRDIKTMMRYVEITQSRVAEEMARVWG